MSSLLDRQLLVITGKGGVGKSTMAAAIALLAAREGRRTIVVEVGAQSRLAELFARRPAEPGVAAELERGLSSISIDPDRALLEWLQALGGRVSGRLLASSGTFQYFAAAAPGAKELVSMVKIWQLTRGEGRRAAAYDLVILDAPATGHALGMLGSPQTFGAIARVGPIAGQTRQLQDLLEGEARSGYLAVALGSEMAVSEVIEIEDGLQRQLGRGLESVIVNALLPRRFTAAELRSIAPLEHGGALSPEQEGLRGPALTATRAEEALARSAARAARAVHERARFQHNQVARLRRRDFEVLSVPFVWGAGVDLTAVRSIAERLEGKL